MRNNIKIGVIGPTIISEHIKQVLKDFPTFQAIYRTSDSIFDAPKFAQQLQDEVDILLFSGELPYKLTKEKITLSIPAHYIPLKGTGLFRSIYKLRMKTGKKANLSIDSLIKEEVFRAFSEVEEKNMNLYFSEESSIDAVEEIVNFHCEKYKSGLTTGALTGIKMVSDRLTELHVPNDWVNPTRQDIVVTLERALLSTETRRNKESQIVFGLIQVHNFRELVEQQESEYGVQKLKIHLQQVLLDYVECLEGHLTSLGGDEYLFVTTRGVFERETRGYKVIPLLYDTEKELGAHLNIGVGFGLSANQAGTHARMALRQAKEFGNRSCFIVREDRNVIGPVEMKSPLVYELTTTDQAIIEKAESVGMTPTYISKVKSHINRMDMEAFTARELSTILNISTRSANRILSRWLDADLVEIIGMEKVVSKGRPRQLYQLNF
ncbi:hypothetical protein [Pontibacillus sp. HMF3514]|uniref:hypothetical protein n=1 Tax=Pontibacillus sp. HMF3514 TaxID=2692425 RepID=UPI0013200502|nr:hypothetical protein [Pontibacillus sp. HMF3514]QHE53023.1 hypothetical protein GS400_13775 [Pontibacillus sp. HMF3514]